MVECKRGQIKRQSYKRSDGTRVKAACVKDVGKPGRTPSKKRILPAPGKDMSLRKYGYSTKKSSRQRRRSLKMASKDIGTLPVLRRTVLIANYSKWNEQTEKKMRDDIEYLKKEYKKEKNITK